MRHVLAKSVWVWVALFCGWFLFYWLTAPVVHVEYSSMVALMEASRLIVTDSGGLQEE